YGGRMSTTFSPVEQESNQEAVLNSPFTGTEQNERVSQDGSTRIRMLHLLVLGGLSALGTLSIDMYVPALPTISHDLGAVFSQTQLTLSAFILGLALGNLIVGPISDAQGRRRPLLIGIATYVIVSLLCGIAPSVAVLTALRFVQGVAGAAGMVIAL